MRLTVFYSLFFLPVLAWADVANLWITEVEPSTGMVEITNVGTEAVTTPTALPFCYRFNYGTSIPTNTHFAPRESKVYSLAGLNASDSDLWLYRSGPFSDGSKILSGLKWGPQSGVGRTGEATNNGRWSGLSDSVAVPGNGGESIHLIGPDPFESAHWAVGPSALGTYPEFPIGLRSLGLANGQVSLGWEGGVPPYQVQSSPTLPPLWKFETGPLTATSATFPITGDPQRRFFRVVTGELVMPLTAQYQLTFEATWSAATHPTNFPGGPHFSGLIGGTHTEAVSFWSPGGIASQGIEDMAEFGGKATLQSEVAAAQTAGTADQVLSGGGISPSPGSVSLTFTVTQSHPRVSVVSMIAPSPDWFVGVHAVALFENNQWKDEVVVDLAPYDAGTDSGASYQSVNADVTPHAPIAEITGFPFEANGAVAPLGTFTFRRIP